MISFVLHQLSGTQIVKDEDRQFAGEAGKLGCKLHIMRAGGRAPHHSVRGEDRSTYLSGGIERQGFRIELRFARDLGQ